MRIRIQLIKKNADPEPQYWYREVERVIEGQVFTRSYDLAPLPPSPVIKLDRRHTGRLRKRDNLLMGEGGGRRAESYDHE